jgi:hypothetical protein
MNIIMQVIALAVFGYIVYLRSSHANRYRKMGYKTWGFNQTKDLYLADKEFKMENTSWLYKSTYIGFCYEFWWSPGGGFDASSYFINLLFISLFIFISIACWQFALACYAVYFMLGRMMS